MEFLQVEQPAFEQAKENFCYSIIQAVAFAAHTLPDAFLAKHLLVLFVLVLPALVGIVSKALSSMVVNHTQNRPF